MDVDMPRIDVKCEEELFFVCASFSWFINLAKVSSGQALGSGWNVTSKELTAQREVGQCGYAAPGVLWRRLR